MVLYGLSLTTFYKISLEVTITNLEYPNIGYLVFKLHNKKYIHNLKCFNFLSTCRLAGIFIFMIRYFINGEYFR